MHRIACTLTAIAVLAGAACNQVSTTESKLVGDWSMPRGEVTDRGVIGDHGYTITSLKADHTFSQTAYPVEAPPARVFAGTWSIEGDQLVMIFTWTHPTMRDVLGQELRFVI